MVARREADRWRTVVMNASANGPSLSSFISDNNTAIWLSEHLVGENDDNAWLCARLSDGTEPAAAARLLWGALWKLFQLICSLTWFTAQFGH